MEACWAVGLHSLAELWIDLFGIMFENGKKSQPEKLPPTQAPHFMRRLQTQKRRLPPQNQAAHLLLSAQRFFQTAQAPVPLLSISQLQAISQVKGQTWPHDGNNLRAAIKEEEIIAPVNPSHSSSFVSLDWYFFGSLSFQHKSLNYH